MDDFLRRVIEGTLYVTEKIRTTGRFSPQPSTMNPPPSTYEPAEWSYQDIHTLHPSLAPLPPFPCAKTMRPNNRCEFACQRRLMERISSHNQITQTRSHCTSCTTHNKIHKGNLPATLKMMRLTRLPKHDLRFTCRGWHTC